MGSDVFQPVEVRSGASYSFWRAMARAQQRDAHVAREEWCLVTQRGMSKSVAKGSREWPCAAIERSSVEGVDKRFPAAVPRVTAHVTDDVIDCRSREFIQIRLLHRGACIIGGVLLRGGGSEEAGALLKCRGEMVQRVRLVVVAASEGSDAVFEAVTEVDEALHACESPAAQGDI